MSGLFWWRRGRPKGLIILMLIIVFCLINPANVLGEGNFTLSDQEKELLKILPQFLFSIPNALADQKNQYQLNQPMGVALDEATGNIYVSDSRNIICVFDSGGLFLGSFGSFGKKPGQFNTPVSLHINQENKLLYVLDQRNFRVQIFSLDTIVFNNESKVKTEDEDIEESTKAKKPKTKMKPKTVIPLPEGTVAQLGEQAFIKRKGRAIHTRSSAVISDAFGKMIVLNGGSHRILIYGKEGEFLTKFSTFGKDKYKLRLPASFDLAVVGYVDNLGRKKERIQYYIADSMNRRVMVVTEKGDFLFAIGAKEEKKAYFSRPMGIAVDKSGKIYVLDTLTAEVSVFDQEGNFILAFGQEGDLYEKLYLPFRIAVNDKAKRLLITDQGNNRVMVYNLGVPQQ